MKKAITVLLCLVLCLGMLAGCGGTKEGTTAPTDAPSAPAIEANYDTSKNASSATPPPQTETEFYDDLSYCLAGKVAVVDPLNLSSAGTQMGHIWHMAYDTLLDYTSDGEYVPSLAKEWSANDDCSEWNFKLRDDVKFHNGEPFTADDVAFTVERAQELPGSQMYNIFGQVAEVVVNGDYDVTLKLKTPNVDFIYDAARSHGTILNREAYDTLGEKAGWIGTGAWKIVNVVANDSVEFEANEDYWGEKPLAKHFLMRFIAEETAKSIMIENGDFTVAVISGESRPVFESNPNFNIDTVTMLNCQYIGFNMKKPVTGDINFRKAVECAIDREEILTLSLDGYGVMANTGTLWGYQTAYKNMDIPVVPQDLDKAREYLAQSSYAGEKLGIAASQPYTIKTALYLQAALNKIGIECEVQQFDDPAMTAATAYDSNNLDIIVHSGGWSPLASSIKAYVTPGNSNTAHYENQEVIDLVAKAATTPDGPEREAMYYRIQEIMAEEIPYIPTQHMIFSVVTPVGTGGIHYISNSTWDFSHMYRTKTP